MSLVAYFLKINLLLSLAAVLLMSAEVVFRGSRLAVPSFFKLQMAYAMMFLSLLAPLLFVNPSMRDLAAESALNPQRGFVAEAAPAVVRRFNDHMGMTPANLELLQGVLVLLLLSGFALYLYEVVKLARSLTHSVSHRRQGAVEIRVSLRESLPSSLSLGRRSYVLAPPSLLADKTAFQHCLSHELQHIRQRDTLWIYLVVLVEKLLFFNPFVRVFVSRIKSLQEIACDEELVLGRKVNPRAYAETLLQMSNWKSKGAGVRLAPSILEKSKTKELIRRINAMTYIKTQSKLKTTFAMFIVSTAVILGGAHFSRAMEIEAQSPLEVYYKMQITENGKVISKPSITTRLGETALMVVATGESQPTRYWKVTPHTRKHGGLEEIVSDIEYGTKTGGVGEFGPDQDEEDAAVFSMIAQGKISTIYKKNGIEVAPQEAKLAFEGIEITVLAKAFAPKPK